MKQLSHIIFIVLIGLNIFFCSWYVLHQDIQFHTDIARDFLLFSEIDQKKFVLLGPRSSTGGLFHGPLWLYVNYPAYILGQGNPIIVGWWWIVLILIFLVTSFYIAKKLFDEPTAYFSTLLLSLLLVVGAKGLFNPYGALFFIPAFFFYFIRYLQTQKWWYLALHFFTAGLIIQFQMAVGIPLLLLSGLGSVILLVKNKHYLHLFTPLILLFPLATFILFDLRHQFLQLHAAIAYVTGHGTTDPHYNTFFKVFLDRLHVLSTSGLQLIQNDTGRISLLLFCVIALFLFLQIKNNQKKAIYLSFLYFYLGYFALSLVQKGIILYHQILPLMALTTLIFSSFITSKYKHLFFVVFLLVFSLNLSYTLDYLRYSSAHIIGKDPESWKFLTHMAQGPFQSKDQSFGYFIYSPDSFAYQPKYAVFYADRHSVKNTTYKQKEAVTYLFEAPPPPDKPAMKPDWWKIHELHLEKKPTDVTTFPNGYTIERFELTASESAIPFDPNIDPGLHFR